MPQAVIGAVGAYAGAAAAVAYGELFGAFVTATIIYIGDARLPGRFSGKG